MQIETYLFFDGRCEEALDFYCKTLGAEVTALMRFKENPEAGANCAGPGGQDEKIMHSVLRIGNTSVMASDGRCEGKASFQGFSLSLMVADESEARRLFEALSDGGQVQMPLSKTFWTSCFGMVADRFGVSWMISVAH